MRPSIRPWVLYITPPRTQFPHAEEEFFTYLRQLNLNELKIYSLRNGTVRHGGGGGGRGGGAVAVNMRHGP